MNYEETRADIIAEMRYGPIPKHRTDHELLALYADRFEAACKRECEASGSAAAMREALETMVNCIDWLCEGDKTGRISKQFTPLLSQARAAIAKPPRKGKWKNGTRYEYEYAYCSACGRMQWAGWDSHREAEDNIEAFADDYRFCPGCGSEMEGGVYVK